MFVLLIYLHRKLKIILRLNKRTIVNTQKLKLPSGKILTKKSRKIFEVQKIKINVLKSEIIHGQS